MDRFKFRVWSVEEKSYDHKFPFNSLGIFYIAETGRLFSDFGNSVAPEMHEDRFVVEQCTGLKDKNGNLIYEGDIVIGRKEIVVCEMIEYKDVVEYKDGEYFPFNCTGVYKPEKFEIIGNIHEQKDNK